MKNLFTLCLSLSFATFMTAQDGMLDLSFNTTGFTTFQPSTSSFPTSEARAVVVQPDGKILVGGVAENANGSDRAAVVRFNADGTLDNSFGTGGYWLATSPESELVGLHVLPNGKILAAGTADLSSNDFYLARLMPDGTPDNSFNGNGYATLGTNGNFETAKDVFFMDNGKVVFVGDVFNPGIDVFIGRMNADGTPDNSFAGNGTKTQTIGASADFAEGVHVQPDGKILVVGSVDINNFEDEFFLLRLNPDGTKDNSFGQGGVFQYQYDKPIGSNPNLRSRGYALDLMPDGSIIAAMYISGLWGVTKITSSGMLDVAYGDSGLVELNFAGDDEVSEVLVQYDGKAIVVGTSDGGTFPIIDADIALARLMPNGDLDSSFGTNGTTVSDFGNQQDQYGYAAAPQPDGKIVVVGSLEPASEMMVARYTTGLPSWVGLPESPLVGLEIFPNPASENLQISSVKGELLQKCDIYNSRGNKVLTADFPKIMKASLNMGNLPAGFYLLYINTDNNSYSYKILKE